MSDLSPATQKLIADVAEQLRRYPASEVTDIPPDGEYDYRLVRESILIAQVCTRKTAEEAAAWLTTVRPPGTSGNTWFVVEGEDEVPCKQFPDTHRHVAVEC
jgi:hypothetical protein